MALASNNNSSSKPKQSKAIKNKKLLILQSYVFKPDILNSYSRPQNYYNENLKFPVVDPNKPGKYNLKKNNNNPNFLSNQISSFENKNSSLNSKKHILKQSIKSLKAHLKDPSEYLNRKSFHKTKFLINKEGPENVEHLRNIFKDYINQNKFYKNEEIFRSPHLEKTTVLNMDQIKFLEKVNEDQSIMEKKYGWNVGNLKKNRLLLENLFLKRLEMKGKSQIYQINHNRDNDE